MIPSTTKAACKALSTRVQTFFDQSPLTQRIRFSSENSKKVSTPYY